MDLLLFTKLKGRCVFCDFLEHLAHLQRHANKQQHCREKTCIASFKCQKFIICLKLPMRESEGDVFLESIAKKKLDCRLTCWGWSTGSPYNVLVIVLSLFVVHV